MALSIRILGAASMLLSHVVLARSLGVSGFGEYAQSIAWLQILCVLGKLGLDNTSLRYVSEYVTKGENGKLHGFFRNSMWASYHASTLVASTAIAVISIHWNAIGSSLATCLILASMMIPLLAMRQVQEASLRGLGYLFESQISTAIWPLILFALAGIVWSTTDTGMSSPVAMLLHFVSLALVSGLVYYFISRSQLRDEPQTARVTCRRQWSNTALTFLVAELLIGLKSRICIALAGAFLGRDSAGLYAAMERFADISVLGSQSLGLVIAPQFAALFAAGRFVEMRRLMWQGQILGLAFTLPVALGVALFGDTIFVLLGSGYQAGWSVLMALLLSACIASFAGPAAYVLQMTGREKTMLVITGSCALTNVVLSLLLMWPWGILGLGISQMATSFVWMAGVRLSLRRHPAWQNKTVQSPSIHRGVKSGETS